MFCASPGLIYFVVSHNLAELSQKAACKQAFLLWDIVSGLQLICSWGCLKAVQPNSF